MTIFPYSKEYQLRGKKKKEQKPLGAGKKTKEWGTVRDDLKVAFNKLGITECEAKLEPCWTNTALGFAHRDKRRFLTKSDLEKVILICNPCHDVIEAWSREKMQDFVDGIIASRTG